MFPLRIVTFATADEGRSSPVSVRALNGFGSTESPQEYEPGGRVARKKLVPVCKSTEIRVSTLSRLKFNVNHTARAPNKAPPMTAKQRAKIRGVLINQGRNSLSWKSANVPPNGLRSANIPLNPITPPHLEIASTAPFLQLFEHRP